MIAQGTPVASTINDSAPLLKYKHTHTHTHTHVHLHSNARGKTVTTEKQTKPGSTLSPGRRRFQRRRGPAPTSATTAAPTPPPLRPKSADRLPPSPAQPRLTTGTSVSTNQNLVTFPEIWLLFDSALQHVRYTATLSPGCRRAVFVLRCADYLFVLFQSTKPFHRPFHRYYGIATLSSTLSSLQLGLSGYRCGSRM